jgi:hypothetical protein
MLSRLASQQSFRLAARTQAARLAPRQPACGLSDLVGANVSDEDAKKLFRTDRLLYKEKSTPREYQYQHEPSFMEKNGLNANEVQYPFGILTMLGLVQSDILVMNEELTLAVCVVMVFGVLKKSLGPMYSEFAMAKQEQAYQAVVDREEATIAAMTEKLEKLTNKMHFSDDMKTMYKAMDEMNEMKIGISNYRKQKEFRAQITKELDAIIKEETRVRSLRQSMLVESATEYVLAQLADEKNVKQAFKDAVAAIGSMDSPPKQDVVTNLYKSFMTDSEQLAAVDAKLN